MINFRKISIIFFSLGIITTPSFAIEDKVLEDVAGDSYAYGFFLGKFTAACGFYLRGSISEKDAKEFFEETFKIVNIVKISEISKNNLLLFFEQDVNKRCKKFIPDN
tara:strand:+ start:30 stop:350 length:321 start_codon:yes stop_codon:yes gene_type:complete